MEISITRFFEAAFFPPGLYFILLVAAWLIVRRRIQFAPWALGLLILVVYATSAPIFSAPLMAALESTPPLSPQQLANPQAQAIVVLSSGYYHPAPEYPATTVDDSNLVRVRYGAFLHRQTGLPVIVSGGKPTRIERSLAEVMAEVLRNEYGIPEVMLEDRSRTTYENALYTQRLLAERNMDTVYLVTHAWHIPRARAVFEQVGVKVIPAPTRYSGRESTLWYEEWLPSERGIEQTRTALHEIIGRVWYAVRH